MSKHQCTTLVLGLNSFQIRATERLRMGSVPIKRTSGRGLSVMARRDQRKIIQAAFRNLPASDACRRLGRQTLLTDTPCQTSRDAKRIPWSSEDHMQG